MRTFLPLLSHQYSGNIQRLFRLQIRLSRKSSTTRKYSKTFSSANLSLPQIINNLKIFKDFSPANCLSRKSSTISQKYSKTFGAAAINGSNQQQQQAAAISNSNQQQQSATATSSNNQQQQPAAAISNSNQQLPSY